MTFVNKVPTHRQEVQTSPLQQRDVRAEVLINAIFTSLDNIQTTIGEIRTESSRVQNIHIPGPCERISAIFAAMLRYIGIIR